MAEYLAGFAVPRENAQICNWKIFGPSLSPGIEKEMNECAVFVAAKTTKTSKPWYVLMFDD